MLSSTPAKKRTRFATIQAAFVAVLLASGLICVWLFKQTSDAYHANDAIDHIRSEMAQMESESLRLCDRLFLDVHQGVDDNLLYWQAKHGEEVLLLRSLMGKIAAAAVEPLPQDVLADTYWALDELEKMDAEIFAVAADEDQEAAEILLSSPDYVAVRAINEQRLKALLREVRAQTNANHLLASHRFETVRKSAIFYASLLACAWIVGLLSLRRWVTREAAAERWAVQAAESRFQALSEASPVGVWYGDIIGNLVYVNPEFQRIARAPTREELLGSSWAEKVYPEDLGDLQAKWMSIAGTKESMEATFRITTPDGSTRWVHLQAAPIIDANQQPAGHTGTLVDITQARESAAKLLASEARYRSVLDEQKEMVTRYDADTTILFVNKAYAEMMGATQEELLGTRWINVIPEEHKQSMLDYVKRVLSNDSRQEIDWPLTHPDGTLHQIRFEDRRMADPVTGSFFIQSVGTDVTESLEAAAQLQASEARYRSVLDEQKEMLSRYDVDTTLLFANKAYAAMFGITEAELLGTHWIDVIPEEHKQSMLDYVKRVLSSESGENIDWQLPHPDGSLRWIHFENRPMTDPVTGAKFVQSVATDVTEARELSQSLQASEARYRSVLDEQKEMLSRYKPDTTVFFGNRAWSEFFQVNLEETPGFQWNSLIPDGERALIDNHLARLLAGEPMSEFEAAIPQHDGSMRWISFQDRLMTDPITGDSFVQSIGSDVTERRQHLIELERYTTALEHSRSAEAKHAARLSQTITELDEARRRAEEGTRAKSAFLANMSHELRTPLNAILGYSEMLIEDASAAGNVPMGEDLGRILQSGRHLLGLINDILDLSKVEAGHMELNIEELQLTDLIREIEHTAIPLAKQHNNVFEAIYDPALGTVWTDVVRVRQILMNLMGNAFKFTENGLVTLRVNRQITDGQDQLVLAVSDNGIGIAPADADRLFLEFTQADVSTTRRYGGTGLGLTLTKRFVELLHGTISVRSELGKGATFTVVLPATQVAEPVELRGRAAKPRQSGPEASLAPMPALEAIANSLAVSTQPLILVIDDDPIVGELLTRQLTPEGYRVEVALDGPTGLIKARELQPNLVTLDLMMPDMDGWEVLSTMKHDPTLAGIPVIIISILNDRKAVMSLGACDALVKPVSPEQLLPVLERNQRGRLTKPVLVVDDDPLVRRLLRRSLEQEGWRIVEATNGQEALAQLAIEEPALVLLDLMMPVMDGFEFLANLRELPEHDDLPIVVLTAMDLTTTQREFLQSAAQGLLQKSNGLRREVIVEIKQVLGRSNAVNLSGYEGALLA